jgi:RNA polymerase-interacting CarD/CdnL/TRCF family regulator
LYVENRKRREEKRKRKRREEKNSYKANMSAITSVQQLVRGLHDENRCSRQMTGQDNSHSLSALTNT